MDSLLLSCRALHPLQHAGLARRTQCSTLPGRIKHTISIICGERELKGRYTSSILTFRDEFVTSGPMECKLLILRCLTRFE